VFVQELGERLGFARGHIATLTPVRARRCERVTPLDNDTSVVVHMGQNHKIRHVVGHSGCSQLESYFLTNPISFCYFHTFVLPRLSWLVHTSEFVQAGRSQFGTEHITNVWTGSET
jgi:hypothetical protein